MSSNPAPRCEEQPSGSCWFVISWVFGLCALAAQDTVTVRFVLPFAFGSSCMTHT